MGEVRLRLTSADIPATLAAINAAGVAITNGDFIDDLTVCFTISRRDYRTVAAIVEKRGDTLRLEERLGIYWTLKKLGKRPVLLGGVAFLLVLSMLIPSRILMIEVEGNQTVPSNLILEKAAQCGIAFGASRRAVRSERVKNALLEAMPELSWAGVNTYGCRAVITVRQRDPEPAVEHSDGVAHIVASRDGYILSCDVLRGSGLCRPGQGVQAGQVLISGYTDCGICTTATHAAGEVMAATRREITALTPAESTKKNQVQGQTVNYSLIIGKNRINFYKNSGISPACCGRMVTNYHLTLPGGYRLPVTLVAQQVISYDLASQPVDGETVLADFATGYLESQMIAGTVTHAIETMTEGDGVWVLAGNYACTEMIGRVQTEQNGELHETD